MQDVAPQTVQLSLMCASAISAAQHVDDFLVAVQGMHCNSGQQWAEQQTLKS